MTFIHRPVLSSPQLFVQSASVHPFPTQVTIVGFQLIFHTIQLEFASTKQMGFLGTTRGCARGLSVSQGELVGEGVVHRFLGWKKGLAFSDVQELGWRNVDRKNLHHPGFSIKRKPVNLSASHPAPLLKLSH